MDFNSISEQVKNNVKDFNFNSIDPQKKIILILALAGVIGSMLPWISFPIVGSIYGLKYFGKFTLPLFLLMIIIILWKNREQAIEKKISLLIPAGISLILGFLPMLTGANQMSVLGGMISASGSFGLGIYMVIVSSAVILYLAYQKQEKPLEEV